MTIDTRKLFQLFLPHDGKKEKDSNIALRKSVLLESKYLTDESAEDVMHLQKRLPAQLRVKVDAAIKLKAV